jgi:hypothetical protein
VTVSPRHRETVRKVAKIRTVGLPVTGIPAIGQMQSVVGPHVVIRTVGLELSSRNDNAAATPPMRDRSAGHLGSLLSRKTHQRAPNEAAEAFYRTWAIAAFGVVGMVCAAPLFIPIFVWFVRQVAPWTY